MNSADWILLGLIGVFAILGIRRGFVGGMLDLVGIGLGIGVALLALPWIDEQVGGVGIDRRSLLLGAGVTIFAVVAFLGSLVGKLIALPWRAVRNLPPVGSLDSLFGLLPGFAKGGLVTSALTLVLVLEFPGAGLTEDVRASQIGRVFVLTGSLGLEQVMDRVDDGFQAWTRRDVQPGQAFVGGAGTEIDRADPAPELEARAMDLVNASRERAGLPALRRDADLITIAREHAASASVFAAGGRMPASAGDVGDRLAMDGQSVLAVGAVLGAGDTVDEIITEMLADSECRREIASPTYVRAAFGVLRGDSAVVLVGVFVL